MTLAAMTVSSVVEKQMDKVLGGTHFPGYIHYGLGEAGLIDPRQARYLLFENNHCSQRQIVF